MAKGFAQYLRGVAIGQVPLLPNRHQTLEGFSVARIGGSIRGGGRRNSSLNAQDRVCRSSGWYGVFDVPNLSWTNGSFSAPGSAQFLLLRIGFTREILDEMAVIFWAIDVNKSQCEAEAGNEFL